jgi:ParB family chromosome partitioning protein
VTKQRVLGQEGLQHDLQNRTDQPTAKKTKADRFSMPLVMPAFRASATADNGHAAAEIDSPTVLLTSSADEIIDLSKTEFDYPHIAEPDPSITYNSSLEHRRNLLCIDISLIDANQLAPREIYTPAMIQNMANALKVQGQHDPIHVLPNPDVSGRFIICDGWTRVLACIEHKVFNSLLAEVHTDLTLEQGAWFGYQQNEERHQHCDLDRAMFYEKLIATGESATEVARKAKISKTLMSYYRSYERLPDSIRELVKQYPDKFTANIAYQFARLNDKFGTRRSAGLAIKFAEEDHTRAWLLTQVEAFLSPTKHKPPPPTRQMRFSNGYYKQRGNTFEINVAVSDEQRDDFAEALEALLARVVEKDLVTQASRDDGTEGLIGNDGV